MKRKIHLLNLTQRVKGIKEQLWYEEALLRHDKRNWCIINNGLLPNALATIVLGIGGKPEKLVNLDLVKRDGIPLIRRFSGGGTVIVDQDSLFVTFIMNTEDTTPNEPYPRPIVQWTAGLYKSVFSKIINPSWKPFELRENDYVFGELKFGGNAQNVYGYLPIMVFSIIPLPTFATCLHNIAIIKDRWLHHTSFLWDFNDANMRYLTIPERRPDYRRDRDHNAFLIRLNSVITEGRDALFKELEKELSRLFHVHPVAEEEARQVVDRLGGMEVWAEKARTKDVFI